MSQAKLAIMQTVKSCRPLSSRPEHGEVRIPIIDFVEAPAGHDVTIRQRQARRVRTLVVRFALQHFPQRVDVLAHVLPGDGVIVRRDVRGGEKFDCHELGRSKPVGAQLAILPSPARAAFGNASTKLLLSGKTALSCTCSNSSP